MFKSTRWRSDKNNKTIKIVLKLQFHATQVSDLKKGERLKICVVPGGDVSSISTVVDDGDFCRWETPLYETVEFNKDFNTNKKLNHKKIYRFVVSKTGGFVGETSCIDFLDYVDSINNNNNNNTCIVSLPLFHHSNSNSNPILHVSIQRQLEETLDTLQSVVKEKSIEAYESRKVSSRIGELRCRQGASIESVSTLSSFESVSELGEVGSRGDRAMMHHHHSESEWSGGSDQGISSTDDSMNSSNDTTVPRDALRTDDEVDKLKAELVALARRADLSELELQSLRKQIVKETKRSQDLLREVTVLKQERDSLKADCDSNNRKMRNKLLSEGRDPQEELDHEKDLNSKLRLQLEKTQESNTELINAVQELEEMLGHRRKREVNLLPRHDDDDDDDDDDEDQKALDELVKGHMDAKEAHALERRITDLYNEIEMYKRDKDDLEIQLEQLALDYEILKQSQVHEQSKLIESIEAKLKRQMEEEIEKQGQVFEEDIEAVMSDKVKQEKRAIEAEEALRKSRLRNVRVAGKIQDEFKRISEQMASTLAANEKMTKKAMTETKELRLQKLHLEELLMNANDEIGANKMVYEAKLKKVESKTATARSEVNNKLCQRNQEENGESPQCAEAIVVQNRHVLSSNKSEDLVNETASLREEYEVMKIELKEMQERYSEISLRFAQVEGERQQLVMTIRCLKIAKNT